jgi:predicted house-cleaning noncanonical NTP pyrophosphatase (MazG superfamily)
MLWQPQEKLIRHKLVDRITQHPESGEFVRKAESYELKRLAREKLFEESLEFCKDPSIKELGDVADVIQLIYRVYGFDPEKIQSFKRGKDHGMAQSFPATLLGYACVFAFGEDSDGQIIDLVELFDLICATAPRFHPEKLAEARRLKQEHNGTFDEDWVLVRPGSSLS